jgi:hypothetical protein
MVVDAAIKGEGAGRAQPADAAAATRAIVLQARLTGKF